MLGMSFLMGCRGLGAIVGPLVSGRWAARDERRMRVGILYGFLAAGIGLRGAGAVAALWNLAGELRAGAGTRGAEARCGCFRRRYCSFRRRIGFEGACSRRNLRSAC